MAADYLGFIERGENVPTIVIVVRLARALRIEPSTLLADIDPDAAFHDE